MSVRRADLHLACGLRNDRPVSVNGAGIRECHCGPGIFNRPDTAVAQPCQFASIEFVAVEWCAAGVSPRRGSGATGRPEAKALPIIDP
jgi:hypothetical protein